MNELLQFDYQTEVVGNTFVVVLYRLKEKNLKEITIRSKYVLEDIEYQTVLSPSLNWFFNSSKDTIETITFENGIDTYKVVNTCRMFYELKNLRSIIGLEYFDMSNVNAASEMFANCYKLKDINIKDWNVSSFQDIYKIFYNCQSIESLDLSKWNTENIERIDGAFAEMYKLKSLDLSS